MLTGCAWQDIFRLSMHKIDTNLRSAKPEMQVIAGGIRCITHILNEFSEFISAGDKRTVGQVFKYAFAWSCGAQVDVC